MPEDHRLESPTTPLLDDPDSFDSPIFMYAPEFKFMPPPTYTEVSPQGWWERGFWGAEGFGVGGRAWFWMVRNAPGSISTASWLLPQVDPCVANNNVQ